MATLIPQSISKSGIPDITSGLVAADVAGDDVSASSGIFILVANGDASPHTLTITKPVATANCGNLGELPVSDITLVVAAGDTGVVSVPSGYSANGLFSWNYDAVTTVTVGVFSIAP